MSTFAERFRYAMDCAGCPTPAGLFDSLAVASANIGAMATALQSLGASATAAEIVATTAGVTLAADVAVALGAVAASYYVGCCIGALIFAASGTFADSSSYSGECNPSDIFSSLSSPIEMQRMAARFNIQVSAEPALALAQNSFQWRGDTPTMSPGTPPATPLRMA